MIGSWAGPVGVAVVHGYDQKSKEWWVTCTYRHDGSSEIHQFSTEDLRTFFQRYRYRKLDDRKLDDDRDTKLEALYVVSTGYPMDEDYRIRGVYTDHDAACEAADHWPYTSRIDEYQPNVTRHDCQAIKAPEEP